EAPVMAFVRLGRDENVAPGPLPIGQAVDDSHILLVDEQGQPVPPGTPGELVMRSRFLAIGYWKDEALTAAHFVPGSDG
ncbi:AMP-binding protein, partial [Streptomyces scabiei]